MREAGHCPTSEPRQRTKLVMPLRDSWRSTAFTCRTRIRGPPCCQRGVRPGGPAWLCTPTNSHSSAARTSSRSSGGSACKRAARSNWQLQDSRVYARSPRYHAPSLPNATILPGAREFTQPTVTRLGSFARSSAGGAAIEQTQDSSPPSQKRRQVHIAGLGTEAGSEQKRVARLLDMGLHLAQSGHELGPVLVGFEASWSTIAP